MELLDYEAAAARLGTTPRHVRNLVARREIDFVKVGKLIRFEPDAVDRYIEARTIQARSA